MATNQFTANNPWAPGLNASRNAYNQTVNQYRNIGQAASNAVQAQTDPFAAYQQRMRNAPNYGQALVADWKSDPVAAVNNYITSMGQGSGVSGSLADALYHASGGDNNVVLNRPDYSAMMLKPGMTVQRDANGNFTTAVPQEQAQQNQPANPYTQQPYQVNPYLAQQAAGLATSAITDFQRTIAPGIRSGAMAAGGFGGSRQGIAEGIAVGDLQRNIANATANLFGNAYEGDQNRATNRYTSDNSLRGTMYSADRSLEGTKYSADKSERVAGMQDSTNRYLGQLQAGTTARGQDITRDLGFANVNLNRYLGDQGNATTMRGQDIQRDLGVQRLGLDSRVADQNYGLGLGAQAINQQNANTNRVGVDNSFALGMGNLALGQGQLGVAQQNAATNRISTDNAYNLGIGNLALGRDQLGVSQANAGTNAAQAGSQMTLNSIAGATNLLNTLYQMGAADQNNPLHNLLLPLIQSLMGTSTGQTGTTTTARP